MPQQIDAYPLPENPHPQDTKDFCVRVPNDPAYISAFKAQIEMLSYWYFWDRDDAHTGKECAAEWYPIWATLDQHPCKTNEPCDNPCFIDGDGDMQFRQSGCALQVQCADGGWTTVYDPSACIASGAGQPPAQGGIGAGDCREFDIVIPGAGRVLLPIPVQNGYEISFSAASGGWWDGGTAQWQCPAGDYYALGTCGGVPVPPVSGDPLMTVPHMRIIAQIGSGYVDAYNQVVTVSGVTGLVDVFVQANDAILSNNQGSVTLHVKVCNPGATEWEVNLNFATSQNGFTVITGASDGLPRAVYTPGVGFQSLSFFGGGSDETDLRITRLLATAGQFTSVTVHYNSDVLVDQCFTLNFALSNPGAPAGTGLNQVFSGNVLSSNLRTDFTINTHGHLITITGITFHGVGVNPF